MNRYKKLLSTLNPQDSFACSKLECIAFILTGQSSLRHSELTEEQWALLSIFENFGIPTLKTNFPYNKKHQYPGAEMPNIVQASVNNGYQYLLSLLDKTYGELVYKHLSLYVNQCSQIYIVTGSLGLQMLVKSLIYLRQDCGCKITVFALGPVTSAPIPGRDNMELITIKGRPDYISRLFDKTRVNYWVDCGHMDYYKNERVKEIIRGYLNQNYCATS
ncbi:MAG: hypothetical protein KDJ52_01805 [Anaerolineae bacterium]|nr:hypothetical protein [Anaerolineae bacterium]